MSHTRNALNWVPPRSQCTNAPIKKQKNLWKLECNSGNDFHNLKLQSDVQWSAFTLLHVFSRCLRVIWSKQIRLEFKMSDLWERLVRRKIHALLTRGSAAKKDFLPLTVTKGLINGNYEVDPNMNSCWSSFGNKILHRLYSNQQPKRLCLLYDKCCVPNCILVFLFYFSPAHISVVHCTVRCRVVLPQISCRHFALITNDSIFLTASSSSTSTMTTTF